MCITLKPRSECFKTDRQIQRATQRRLAAYRMRVKGGQRPRHQVVYSTSWCLKLCSASRRGYAALADEE